MDIVFVSNGDEYAHQAYSWLKGMCSDCIVLASLVNQRIERFPPQYDLGISFLYGHKIPKQELIRPWINLHPAPLPEYRGRNVAYHAIMNKENRFGATIHYMSDEFDTGDVIEVSWFDVSPSDTAGDVGRKSRIALVALFKKYMPLFLEHVMVPAIPQQEGRYYYGKKIDEIVPITEDQSMLIRSLTYDPQFYPKLRIGGRLYEIRPLNTREA